MAEGAERFGGMVSSMDMDERFVYGCSSGSISVWEKESMRLADYWAGIGQGLRITVDASRVYCTSLYHFLVVDKRGWTPLYEARFGSDISSDLGRPINDEHSVYFPIRNGDLVVIDKQEYQRTRILREHEGTIWGMDQDDRFLYTGSVDKTIRIWCKQSLSVVRVLEGHRGNVQRVHVCGPYLVSGATDLSVIIWDRLTGQMVHRIRNAHKRAINGLASWRGRLLTSSMAERKVRIWELGSWRLVKEMEISLAEGAAPRVDGERVYLAFRREPGVHSCPAEQIFS